MPHPELWSKVLEDAVFENPTVPTLAEIQRLKVELLRFRKAVWPLREKVNGLVREESDPIADRTEIFLRDVYDHAIQVIDTVEGFRDTVSGLLDVYLSSVSNRMNEVMKVLTIMASVFIPLTFIAGIYGMNFKQMPELEFEWAYPVLLAAMVVVTVGMIVYFRRKGWLGGLALERPDPVRKSRTVGEERGLATQRGTRDDGAT